MTEPSALVPPPEHIGGRWHWLKTNGVYRDIPAFWSEESNFWRPWLTRVPYSPEDAWSAGWRYLGPYIPNATTRIAELESEVKRLRVLVPDPENKETETRVMRAIWNAAHPIARFDEPDVGPGGNERATLTRQARAAIRALIGESHDN